MKTFITALLLSLFSFINVQAQEAFTSSEMLAFNETTKNYNAPDAEMSLAATFDGGTGTESDPYQISTAVQLQAIGDNLGSHFVLTGNIDAATTSGWNGGEGFAPIGSSANPFNGSLDGKEYKIFDLTINRPTEDNVGLFASIGTNGSVKNLGLDQASVTGGNYVGGLVGMNLGNVSYSYSTGSVSGGSYVGGLIGDHSLNTVSNSYSTSTVTGTYTTGGFIGISYDNIDKSFAKGNVNGDDRVGGFIGEINYGAISNSYSTGSVSGTSSVGGFVGYKQINGATSNTFWDMETSGTTAAAGAGSTSGMTGETTAQMTTESPYTGAGWDFTSVWMIDGAVNGGYPSLLPQPNPPVFNSSATGSVPENTLTTTTVLDVEANDGDGGAIDEGITYSITGGADMTAFNIDAASGAITFAAVPDFDNPADFNADNVYELTVEAYDGSTINNTATQDITITVTDVNEVPVFTSSATASVPENTTATVLDVEANDGDGGSIDVGITYSITDGADMGAFNIDPGTGVITFAAVPDFENPADADADNVYELTVQADDGGASNNTATQDITITVTDVNEAPSLTLGTTSGSLDENNTPPNVLTTITINDDGLGTETLSLSGADAGSFNINTSNELEFTATADFETKSSYTVTVEVDDADLGTGPEDSQEFTLTINDVNDAPVIANAIADIEVTRNAPDSTIDLTQIFSDPDAGDTDLTYSVVTNTNPSLIDTLVDNSTNVLTIIFQADQTGTTELTIRATDSGGLSVDGTLKIMVVPFYLADNGVTIMCPNASVGDSEEVNGVTYTKRSKNQINPTNASTTCTSEITDMSLLFFQKTTFNEDIGHWDVSSVTNMYLMFDNNHAFNQEISDWDVSSVTRMAGMFSFAHSFDQNIGSWDVSSVTDMSDMFLAASQFNQDLSRWNVSGVKCFEKYGAFGNTVTCNTSNKQSTAKANPKTKGKTLAEAEADSISGFLVGSGLSSENADKLFIGWSQQDLQDGVSISIGDIELSEAGATAMKTMREANNMVITWGGQQGVEGKPVFTELPAPFEVLFEESRVLSLWDYVSDTATPDNELQFSFAVISDSAQTFGYDATSGALSITAPAYADTFRVAMQVRNNEGIASLDTLEVHSVSEITTSVDEEAVIPNEFVLKQNYPNPFNPTTTINYGVPEAAEVQLEVFDMLGRKVATLVNKEFKAAGTYSISFDASSLASGIYIYRMVSGKTVKNQKMTLLK